MPLRALSSDVRGWFEATYPGPTPAQELAIPRVASGRDVLVASPTGSGKTLAAFLAVLSELHALAARDALPDATLCVYVSPLKALVADVARNLESPLAAIAARIEADGRAAPAIRVGRRTGDTPPSERERHARAPPHILVTTPESLALVLSSARMRRHLRELRWIVVDEVHALAGTKRGAHLSVSLERLARLARGDVVRVGLSATVSPLPLVAEWLGGTRPVEAVEARVDKSVSLRVELIEDDDEVVARLAGLVEAHRTTLVFARSRHATERLAQRLRERLGEEDVEDETSVDPAFGEAARPTLVEPHHGSMSRETRAVVEERLKRQELRCVVTSSSLELGIHVEGVDHVALVGSPKSAARALQRVGRSGHRMGGASRGTLIVDDAADLAEAFALARLVAERSVEDVEVPRAPLDVAAQHLLGLAIEGPVAPHEAHALLRRALPFRELARVDVDDLFAMLERRGLVARDGERWVAAGPRSLQMHSLQGGVIPDAGLVKAFAGDRYVGELEEAFIETLTPGDTFVLSGETWRFLGASGQVLQLSPARTRHGALPAWRSDGLAATTHLARATRPLRRTAAAEVENSLASLATPETYSRHLEFRALQAAFAPLHDGATLETFVDDHARRVLVLHLDAGRRATEPLARVLAHRLGHVLQQPVRHAATDAGLALLAPRRWKPTRAAFLKLLAAPLAADLRVALTGSELLKRRFRHVAFRTFLLRKHEIPPGHRQREANQLLAAIEAASPDHPALREAWREALHDALDAEGAEALRAAIVDGALPLAVLPPRPCASPLAARIVAPPDRDQRIAALRDADERVAEAMQSGQDVHI